MKKPIYAALDLHSGMSVLGSMDHDGQTQPRMRLLLKQAFGEHRWSGYGESDGRFTSRWKRERSPAGPAGLCGHWWSA